MSRHAEKYLMRKFKKRKYKSNYKKRKYKVSLPGEIKYHDIVAITAPPIAGTLTLLNGIGTGTAHNQRIGNRIKILSLQSKGILTIQSAINQVARFLMFIDKQPNGVAPAVADLLQTVDVSSPLNLTNTKRFKVLVDKRFTLNANGNNNRIWKHYKKCNYTMMYDGAGNTVASINSGSLYALWMTDQAANPPAFDYYIRMRYIDG